MSLCFEDACPVSTLKDKIEQLEREAEWLAQKCAVYYIHNSRDWPNYKRKPASPETWRDAARKAVSHD